MIHYCNPALGSKPLVRALGAASAHHRADALVRRRHRQHRLDEEEVRRLIAAYRDRASVKDLAKRFTVHRGTVTAILKRHGVELRQPGLRPEDVPVAVRLYRDGWSVARLGAKFSVDGTTVWRALRAARVEMRDSHRRKQ